MYMISVSQGAFRGQILTLRQLQSPQEGTMKVPTSKLLMAASKAASSASPAVCDGLSTHCRLQRATCVLVLARILRVSGCMSRTYAHPTSDQTSESCPNPTPSAKPNSQRQISKAHGWRSRATSRCRDHKPR